MRAVAQPHGHREQRRGMTILFWDIDGTLLTTGKAGVPAWEQAVREVTGKDFQLSSIRVAGLTDFQIAARTFDLLGVPATGGALERMVSRYEDLLPSTLPLKQGRVLPNVREILEALRECPDVRSYLLTGNTRRGARAKLTHYNLFQYFPDGAFAEDQGNRASIATRARDLARRHGTIDEEQLFVIGDTPHDIECGIPEGQRTCVGSRDDRAAVRAAQHLDAHIDAERVNALQSTSGATADIQYAAVDRRPRQPGDDEIFEKADRRLGLVRRCPARVRFTGRQRRHATLVGAAGGRRCP